MQPSAMCVSSTGLPDLHFVVPINGARELRESGPRLWIANSAAAILMARRILCRRLGERDENTRVEAPGTFREAWRWMIGKMVAMRLRFGR